MPSRLPDPVSVSLDNEKGFDLVVHGPASLPHADQLLIVTKDNGTESGRAIAALTFEVQLPDGSMRRAQYTTTIRLLKTALQILDGRYDDDGRPRVGKPDAN